MKNHAKILDLNEQILLTLDSLEESGGGDEFIRLEKMIAESSFVAQQYVEFMEIFAFLSLYNCADTLIDDLLPSNEEFNIEDVLFELIEQDKLNAARLAAEKAQKEAEATREAARQMAEEKFKNFQEELRQEERRRQEKLAYKRYRFRQQRFVYAIVALAASLAIIVLSWIYARKSPEQIVPPVLATITKTFHAQWDRLGTPISPGTKLTASPVNVTQGSVEIAFNDGAQVTLYAPVHFEPQTGNQMYLHRGKLLVNVPPEAFGFSVNTPSASVKDIGTEFGVEVDETQQSELQVFKGEVVLFTKSQNRAERIREIVEAGQARIVKLNDNKIYEISFRQPSSFKEISASHLLAYWTFDKDLTNSQGDSSFDGKAVGDIVISGEDAKVGDGALKIDDGGTETNYVSVEGDLVGTTPAVRTVVAWYKYQDISGDGSDQRNFIWETSPNFSLSFAIGTAEDDGHKRAQWHFETFIDTGKTIDMRSDLNKGPLVNDGLWHHAAVIWNKPAGTIKYYHDGVLHDFVPIPYGQMLKHGLTKYFYIGNHREGDGTRNWDGYIDEMAIYDVELSPEQIQALFTAEYRGKNINAGNVTEIVP